VDLSCEARDLFRSAQRRTGYHRDFIQYKPLDLAKPFDDAFVVQGPFYCLFDSPFHDPQAEKTVKRRALREPPKGFSLAGT
jgi:hypothetical protein